MPFTHVTVAALAGIKLMTPGSTIGFSIDWATGLRILSVLFGLENEK